MPPLGAMGRSGDYGRGGDVEPVLRVVRAIYDAFAERDLERALTHMHDDIVLVPAGTSSLIGRAEPYLGHDGVRRYFADMEAVWDELTLRVDDIRAANEGAVVFGSAVGSTGGKPYERRALWTWKVRNGLAVEMRVNLLGPAS